MAKYGRGKRIEKQEVGVLEILLNAHPLLTQLTKGDDDFPLIDGYIHLLGEQDEVDGNMLKVQVKPLKPNKDGTFSATCGTDLLSHAHGSSVPVILIAVNPDEQIAYWMYLAPEAVKTQYEAQTAAGKKTITFRLNKNHVIKKGTDKYIAEWKRICGHHRNTSNDRLASRYKKRIKKNIITANEDTLLERIRTLHDLVYYRTNKGEFPLVEIVLEMARTIGDTSASVKIAYIELLEQLIHDKTTEVLEIITRLASDESEQVRKKAAEALKNTSKYNYHWLNAIGYGPYRSMLNFLGSHDVPSDIAHEMFRNLLSPDFDGTSQTDMYTLTFHRGALDATKFLKDLRQDAINLLAKRYGHANTMKEKSKTIDTIGYATHKTDWPTGDPDFIQRSVDMVEANTELVVASYKKILFPNGKMIAEYPVVYEIETQLSLLATRERKITGVEELLRQVREDKGDYRLFSLLAGDEMRLRHDIEWQEGRRKKEEELKEMLELITVQNADEWYTRIDAVANFRDSVEDWLFQTMRDFLAQIAEHKPAVAAIFAKRAFDSKSGIYFFVRSILWGLRRSSLKQWDEHVAYIAKEKLSDHVDGILMSYFSNGTELPTDKIREDDVRLALEISEKKDRFSFLKKPKVNWSLEHHSIRVLAFLSTRGIEVRKALLEKIKEYPELDTMFADQLGFALHCKWIKFDEWDHEELQAIAEMLVNIKSLNHDELQILHALGTVDFDLMMSVFERRIKRPYNSGYDSIPYHFENSFMVFIRDNPRTKNIVGEWLKERDPEQDGMIGYHLGEFFNRIGGDVLRDALSELIATGKKENILKVMEMLPISGPADPSLCLEIVAATDDKQILARVDARMRQTGGGSGAAGENIFAREMRKNQARIEEVKSKATNPKIIKFCEKVLANLAKDISRSEREHEREMREERQEYEDEHPKD
jgi:Domain of unknown function (DUF4365)